ATTRFGVASRLVVALKLILRAEGVGGTVRSRMVSAVVSTSTKAVDGSVVVLVLVVPATDVVVVVPACVVLVVAPTVVVVVVVVVEPTPHAPVSVGGKLCGSAGSVLQSSSRRSNTPSRSRSMPIRVPDPGGTQVKVISWPAVPARLRTCVVVSRASEWR